MFLHQPLNEVICFSTQKVIKKSGKKRYTVLCTYCLLKLFSSINFVCYIFSDAEIKVYIPISILIMKTNCLAISTLIFFVALIACNAFEQKKAGQKNNVITADSTVKLQLVTAAVN